MTVSPEIITFAISMVPVVELRGSIPYGAAMGLSFFPCLILSIIGNLLPTPFIVLFVRKIFNWLKTMKFFKPFAEWSEKHVLGKRDVIARYETIGLAILVAIPLPGTGAWTGAMLAGLLGMRLKNALPAIILGVIVAAIIVSCVTYGFVGAIDFFALHA